MGHGGRSVIRLSPSPRLPPLPQRRMSISLGPFSLLSLKQWVSCLLSVVVGTLLTSPQSHGVPDTSNTVLLTPALTSTWDNGSCTDQKHMQGRNYRPPRPAAGDCSVGGTQEPSTLTVDNVPQDFTWKYLGWLLPLTSSPFPAFSGKHCFQSPTQKSLFPGAHLQFQPSPKAPSEMPSQPLFGTFYNHPGNPAGTQEWCEE